MDESRKRAQRRALAALMDLWGDLGRPGVEIAPQRYMCLYDSFVAHVNIRFKDGLPSGHTELVVDVFLRDFLAPLYRRHVQAEITSPEDVLDLIDDHVFTLQRSLTQNGASDPRTVHESAHVDRQRDGALLAEVFGTSEGKRIRSLAFRHALAELHAEERRVEYLVVVQYLDSREMLGNVSNEDVADRLQGVLPGLTPERVRKVVLEFHERLIRAQL